MSLAVALLCIALADLVAGGLGGQPRSLGRSLLAVAIAGVVGIVLIVVTATDSAPVQVLLLIATLLFWNLGRTLGQTLHPVLPLLALTSGLGSSFLAGLSEGPFGPVGWLASPAYPGLAGTRNLELLLVAACALFLTGTSNSIVRAVLQIAGTPLDTSASRLRGGRIIGILERGLIFGLALTGEPTAAALVVSAKSILRFPELSKLAREDHPGVDELTEYFLVGSLSSWALSLLAAALVHLLC